MEQPSMELIAFLENNWFALTLLVGLATFAWRLSNSFNTMKNDIEDKFQMLDDRIKSSETYRTEDKEREGLIMQGVEATLRTLHAQGANGPVTESLNAIENYKSKKALE